MKVRKLKNGEVEITLETDQEKTLFGNLFNCAPISDAIEKVFKRRGEEFYNALNGAGCQISGHTSALANALLSTHYIQSKLGHS